MKIMKRIFTAVALLLLGVRCHSPKIPVLPVGFEYTITDDKLDKGLDRRTVRVTVSHEIDEPIIKDLSNWIKDNRTDAKNMIIFYYVKNGKYISDSWVRVDYNPEYKYDLVAVPIL